MIAHLGLNHKTAPVHVRERFAFNAFDSIETLTALLRNGLAEEGILISTCNRVELYIAGDQVSRDSMRPLLQFLARSRSIEYTDDLEQCFYFNTDAETLHHLFR
ncbi:MAG: glutamyl-tRNA reductase, partial [Verrucomicrobia bacterium]|nr:glutamyl-tRNA reductase [Verrucomicrobiota bacterium]